MILINITKENTKIKISGNVQDIAQSVPNVSETIKDTPIEHYVRLLVQSLDIDVDTVTEDDKSAITANLKKLVDSLQDES